MFEGWGNYYFLLGSASAALVGVMSLVATLTSGGNREKAERGQRLFLTPNVFHLAAVLAMSAVALIPTRSRELDQLLIGAVAAYGFAYATVITVQLARRGGSALSHWSDFWCYGAAPLAAFTVILAALLWTLIEPGAGCDVMALGILAVLLMAVRNAWDLVTWLAPMRAATLEGAAMADPPPTPTAD